MMDFIDEQRMCRLYEKFILEYYRKHYYPQIKASASQIDWALDDGLGTMLPTMQSDIMLSCKDKTLIIDAKYYPDSNYGYKASQAKSFADCIEFYDDWGPMTDFRLDNLIHNEIIL